MRAGGRRDGDGAEEQALLQAQQRQEFRQVDEELQYNEVLIEERDEAIQEISQQIGEVHEIFQARRRLHSTYSNSSGFGGCSCSA